MGKHLILRIDYTGRHLGQLGFAIQRNRDAEVLERFLKKLISTGRTGFISYDEISATIGLDVQDVRVLLFSLDNSFTGLDLGRVKTRLEQVFLPEQQTVLNQGQWAG